MDATTPTAMGVDAAKDVDEGKQPATKGFELPWVSVSCFRHHNILVRTGNDISQIWPSVDVRERGCLRCLPFMQCKDLRHAHRQVEKYRPQLIKDIVGNVEAVARLQVISEEGNMPNLILAVCCMAWHVCSSAPWHSCQAPYPVFALAITMSASTSSGAWAAMNPWQH